MRTTLEIINQPINRSIQQPCLDNSTTCDISMTSIHPAVTWDVDLYVW